MQGDAASQVKLFLDEMIRLWNVEIVKQLKKSGAHPKTMLPSDIISVV
jgi:hypothetical protein